MAVELRMGLSWFLEQDCVCCSLLWHLGHYRLERISLQVRCWQTGSSHHRHIIVVCRSTIRARIHAGRQEGYETWGTIISILRSRNVTWDVTVYMPNEREKWGQMTRVHTLKIIQIGLTLELFRNIFKWKNVLNCTRPPPFVSMTWQYSWHPVNDADECLESCWTHGCQ